MSFDRTDIDIEVGRLVRVERISRGLSQTELGNQIGVTFQQIQKYESGANRISMGRLTRIARVFGVNVTYLLGGTRRAAPAQPSIGGEDTLAEAMRMLSDTEALRLLRAFNALPHRPTRLRFSIVDMVEATASAANVRNDTRRRSGRRSTRARKD
jgi:transcriptional regulator with XRE-family HTH domain